MIILPLFLLLVISSNFAENSESFCRFCIALMESFKEQVEINPKFGQVFLINFFFNRNFGLKFNKNNKMFME